MLYLIKRKEIIYISFLLFFINSSCTISPSPQWNVLTISSEEPCVDYSKSLFPSCNTFNGLEAEFLYNGNETTLFLNIQTMLFSPSALDENMATIFISIEDHLYEVLGEILQGGQRIRVPPEAKKIIIDALLDQCEVGLVIGRYQAKLIPNHFTLGNMPP